MFQRISKVFEESFMGVSKVFTGDSRLLSKFQGEFQEGLKDLS